MSHTFGKVKPEEDLRRRRWLPTSKRDSWCYRSGTVEMKARLPRREAPGHYTELETGTAE
jgi:hypothetical protein